MDSAYAKKWSSQSIIDSLNESQQSSALCSLLNLTAQKILESPDYFPLKFDGPNLVFVKMSRDSYHQSIFTLPNRIVCAGPEQWSVPFYDLVELVEHSSIELQQPACLFQIAHCGSTLLSRALDRPKTNLVIREPYILRQFAATPFPVATQDIEFRRRSLVAIWHLLGRRYKGSEVVLIKANVPVNFALNEILEIAPKIQGVLLYSEFNDYLLSVLKTDQRRQWAQYVVRELMPRIQRIKGLAQINFELLDPAQSAAVLWMGQIRNFEEVLNSNLGLRPLLSDQFFKQPARCLSASAAHLDIDIDQEQASKIVAGDLFKLHAKLPEQKFSEQQRQQELQQLSTQYHEEITNCQHWLNQNGFNLSHHLANSALK